MKKLIIFPVLFTAIVSFAQVRDKSFDAFWPKFRTAVLAYDIQTLDQLVLYPLTVKGTQDYDPVKKINRNKIIATLKTYMAKYAIIETGFDDETNLEQIKRKATLPASAYNHSSPNFMSVGDLEFKKIAGKWKLFTIYIATIN